MTGKHDERDALTAFLRTQRRCVLAIVEGLDEPAMRQPVVPSGWTALGLIEHLAQAEHFWFTQVITGIMDLSGDVTETEADNSPFDTTHTLHEVLTFYRQQTARADSILAGTPLDASPAGHIPPDMADEIHTIRDVVLHMIEETARHAGHLDIARELLDGKTGLGPR
jgi:uncharacterized damage-inducible protein DinB